MGLSKRQDKRLEGPSEFLAFQIFRLEAANKTAHLVNDRAEVIEDAPQFCVQTWAFFAPQAAAIFQMQANRIDRLDDPVVQISANPLPLLERFAQFLFARTQGGFSLLALRNITRDT